MLTRADLHIHSTASDGDLNPWEIVIAARDVGIDTIALADHNTTRGIAEAVAAGRQFGVSVIPAVELSTKFRGESIHLLGYFRNGSYANPIFEQILRCVKSNRINEARSILKGFTDTDHNRGSLSVNEGINLLRSFGAAVVLGHPSRISQNNLNELLDLNFDGVEAKYCHNTLQQTSFFMQVAAERFSFYSGGSDFHTSRNPHQLHCFIGQPCLEPMELQMFLNNSGAIILS